MTEPVNKDGEILNPTPVTAVNDGVPSTTPKTVEEKAWWKEAQEKHGFKSEEDVYKSWSESNKKITEQGEQLKSYEDFQKNIVPFIDIVLQDEEMLGKVKAKLEGKVPQVTPASVNNQVPPEDTETKKYLTDNIVHSFEEKHGISKLDEATQKDIKAKIGLELKNFTDGKNLNINKLPQQLEKAFTLAVAGDDKLKAIFESKDDTLGDYGSLPSQSSGVDKDGKVKLTPEQLKVAENMPGGVEAYIKGLTKIQAK